MSQTLAFANAWNLATTLMVCVVIFRTGMGGYGVYLNSQAVSLAFR